MILLMIYISQTLIILTILIFMHIFVGQKLSQALLEKIAVKKNNLVVIKGKSFT